ncbi:uncharacterized protein LOC129972563 [Argiope bruennichi]|uniref:uncharacterized protein LOC129972563 n=1 Tax=Argiope bruennichi TaxID=94029 RepID=UPI0024952916|nr:uncharacterized protein LOC129972563 [Argiope bruennichi]
MPVCCIETVMAIRRREAKKDLSPVKVLHLSLLVACAFADYTKGLSGKFPKLEDINAEAKVPEARFLYGIPEPKSEELLGLGLGDVKTIYGTDGSLEKTFSLPGEHAITAEVGKDGGFRYGYTTEEHGEIGGLDGASGFNLGEGYGISEKSHGHGYGHGGGGGGYGHGGGHGHGGGNGHGQGHGHGHGHGHGQGHGQGHGTRFSPL